MKATIPFSAVFQPQRGGTYQPRATPWVNRPHISKP